VPKLGRWLNKIFFNRSEVRKVKLMPRLHMQAWQPGSEQKACIKGTTGMSESKTGRYHFSKPEIFIRRLESLNDGAACLTVSTGNQTFALCIDARLSSDVSLCASEKILRFSKPTTFQGQIRRNNKSVSVCVYRLVFKKI